MMPFQDDPSSDAAEQLQRLADGAGQDMQSVWQNVLHGKMSAAWPFLVGYVLLAVEVIILLIAAFLAARMISRLVSRPIRDRVDRTLGQFIGRVVYYAILASAIIAVLGRAGFHVTSFAALLASVGFAVGMALQGSLGNIAAGIMLLVFRPFKVGDVIRAADVTASVFEIGLFNTTLDTFDNRRLIVPNTSITAGTIENISHHSERRIDLEIGCDYTADLHLTRDVLTAAAESQRENLLEGENRGFTVALTGLGESAVQWAVRFWTTAEDFWSVREALLVAIKNGLDNAGIGIPYPQLDVHLNTNSDGGSEGGPK